MKMGKYSLFKITFVTSTTKPNRDITSAKMVAEHNLEPYVPPEYDRELQKFQAASANGRWECGTFLKLLERDLGPTRLENAPNSHKNFLIFCLLFLNTIIRREICGDLHKLYPQYPELEEMTSHLLGLVFRKFLQISTCFPWCSIFYSERSSVHCSLKLGDN
jgi:hypothetical protein